MKRTWMAMSREVFEIVLKYVLLVVGYKTWWEEGVAVEPDLSMGITSCLLTLSIEKCQTNLFGKVWYLQWRYR